MKNLILLFAFAFFMGNNSFAQGIQFDKGEWQEILNKAKEEDKLIFVDAYAAWCGPCKKMARDVFTKPAVGEFFNAKFVNAKIDMEKGVGPSLAQEWKVRAYPTLLFVDGSGDVVHQAVGYHTTDLLIELGEAALDPDRNTVQMDLFPTNLLDNIVVYKNFTPDLPGDFTPQPDGPGARPYRCRAPCAPC